MSDIHVTAGQSLQAAIDSATSGDSVLLERGATFQGNFFPGTADGVTVRTDGEMPARRVGPADAGPMAKLASGNNDPVLYAKAGRQGWTFAHVQFVPGIQDGIVIDGASRITLHRVLQLGGTSGMKRGIRGNGTNIVLRESHIGNCWSDSQDAQAYCAWDGAGPHTLEDNYLEASGENVMFGGANSAKPENIPADITVTNNLMFKPAAWRGTQIKVKNLFELKSAKRARITGNRFEGCWTMAQPGYGIVLTTRNDEGGSPWSCVEDVLFENNVVIAEKGLNILGCDSYQPSGFLDNVVIRKSLFITEQRGWQVGNEVQRLTFDHLSFINGSDRLGLLYRDEVWHAGDPQKAQALYAIKHFTHTNCLGSHRQYGIFADGNGQGASALADMCEYCEWSNNAVAEPGSITYPPGTLSLSQAEHDAQFVGDNYLLKPDSRYRNVNGTDLGWTGSDVTPEPEPNPEVTTITLTIVHQGKTITVTLPGTVKVEP